MWQICTWCQTDQQHWLAVYLCWHVTNMHLMSNRSTALIGSLSVLTCDKYALDVKQINSTDWQSICADMWQICTWCQTDQQHWLAVYLCWHVTNMHLMSNRSTALIGSLSVLTCDKYALDVKQINSTDWQSICADMWQTCTWCQTDQQHWLAVYLCWHVTNMHLMSNRSTALIGSLSVLTCDKYALDVKQINSTDWQSICADMWQICTWCQTDQQHWLAVYLCWHVTNMHLMSNRSTALISLLKHEKIMKGSNGL